MPKPRTELTAERLRYLLSYDSESGIFHWRNPTCTRIKVGDLAGRSCNRNRYRRIKLDGREYLARRLAWLYVSGVWPQCVIDHKHGTSVGDGIDNLRDVSQSFNQQNRTAAGRNSNTGILGVSYCSKTCKFRARIEVRGRDIYLGHHVKVQDAQAAYLQAKHDYHPGSII